MSKLLATLASKSRLTLADTAKIVATATKRYKVYAIKKANGGERIIAHPARELKAVQRGLLQMAGPQFIVNPCVTAYEKGCSIKLNAEAHRNSQWLAKFDIKNFFNSINQNVWLDYLQSIGVDSEWADISGQVFFWKSRYSNVPCLSVGAPSSPFASNRFMNSYDNKIDEFCRERGWIYTRYADDVTISGSDEVEFENVKDIIRNIIEEPGIFLLNDAKSRFLTKGVRRSVTGIVITNDGSLSIGRKRRRNLEARLHHYIVKKKDDEVSEIRGQLAFLKMVDRARFLRLAEKYRSDQRSLEARLF